MLLRHSLPVACSLLLCATACTTTQSGSDRPYNLIVSDTAPLYATGPYQHAPDARLAPGTRVRALGSVGEYTRVETVTGLSGFVPSNALTGQGGL